MSNNNLIKKLRRIQADVDRLRHEIQDLSTSSLDTLQRDIDVQDNTCYFISKSLGDLINDINSRGKDD